MCENGFLSIPTARDGESDHSRSLDPSMRSFVIVQIGNTRYIKYFRETKLSVMEVVGFDQSQWSIKRRRSQL